MITDATGRIFKKLRISLTHECNYACVYCVDNSIKSGDSKNITPSILKPLLTSSDIISIVKRLHTNLNLNAIRLTGGEPLLHPRINTIISDIKEMGIANIGMTTNGHLLSAKAQSLYDSGLESVNISLDALNPETFVSMSLHNGLSTVLKAIDAALSASLKVKINTVVVSGKNDQEIVPLLEYAINKNIIIRFLELMPMGPLHKNRKEMFFSKDQILANIQAKYSIEALSDEPGSTADYWNINGKKAFGIIANDSSPFCSDCNRLRLDSYGNIYGCLSSLIPISINKEIPEPNLNSALQLALSHKQTTHFMGNDRTMQSIGG